MNTQNLMPIIRDVMIFLAANVVGFFGGPLVYNIGIVMGFISVEDTEANIVASQNFLIGTTYLWLGCVVISLAFFIVEKRFKARWLFLLCPLIVPMIYGFSVLNTFSVTP